MFNPAADKATRDVYPNVTFNDLREESPLKRIFDVFCYDINGKIIRQSKDSVIVGFDINVQNTVDLCEDKIVPSNENFNKIIMKNNFIEFVFINE